MKLLVPLLISTLIITNSWSQEDPLNIRGRVLDAKTKEPLPNASVDVKPRTVEAVSGLASGAFEFRIPSSFKNDSLEISHVGYKTFRKRIADIKSPEDVFLEPYTTELRAVTITSRKLSMKDIDRSLRRIKGNLYAYETETTNGMYNLFLSYLEEHGQSELLKQCEPDLSGYDNETKEFYKKYGNPFTAPVDKKDTLEKDYTDFPAVNIKHGAVLMFCQWLTEQYNSNPGKKRFSNVKFRLPTLKEWQIAALGYDKFQSWNLEENTLEVIVPDDTLAESRKGKKTKIQFNNEILYPWWNHYHYRNKAINTKNCYLGNFKASPTNCAWGPLPNYDGWSKMARTTSYFPNGIGLYDVVGNVAEMIDEKGKACGGSWNDVPEASTIRSVKNYRKPDATIGFRVFMEVVEP